MIICIKMKFLYKNEIKVTKTNTNKPITRSSPRSFSMLSFGEQTSQRSTNTHSTQRSFTNIRSTTSSMDATLSPRFGSVSIDQHSFMILKNKEIPPEAKGPDQKAYWQNQHHVGRPTNKSNVWESTEMAKLLGI
jgi:hypothetical protein